MKSEYEEREDDELLRATLNSVLRAESDNHVPRAVVALESIAKSLEVLAAKHGEQRDGTWLPSAGVHTGTCAKCGRLEQSLNATTDWCFNCFSGKGPMQL